MAHLSVSCCPPEVSVPLSQNRERYPKVRMPDPSTVLDLDAEASHISVQAVPGAVFLRLRRERVAGTARRMFVEMTVAEAVALRRALEQVIGVATAA